MGVNVEWFDKILGEIEAKRKHLNLLQENKGPQEKLKQLDWEREEIVGRLGEIDVERFIRIKVFKLSIIIESLL